MHQVIDGANAMILAQAAKSFLSNGQADAANGHCGKLGWL